MKNTTILLVDDDEVFVLSLKNQLQRLGHQVISAGSGQEALQFLRTQPVDLVITDLFMPEMSGLDMMRSAKADFPTLPFIVVTARGSVESAVEATRQGVFDYLEKPIQPESLDVVLKRALNFGRLADENEQLRGHYCERFSFHNIVTQSPIMRQALEMAARMADSPRTTVSLIGESGVGKEVLARAIHYSSGGFPNNFAAINCAAIPEQLMESELFGHVRGAFTGADRDREGKFSLANEGTIFLDEIGDMPLALQVKLLRVLEERAFEKVGSNKPLPLDCRVMVATHQNLAELVQRGKFREDLYYRINVVPITIPPLRERKEDIPLLVEFFLGLSREHQGKALPGVTPESMKLLTAYAWPGNVRELRNVLEYASIMVNKELIRPEHLRFQTKQRTFSPPSEKGQIDYHVSLPVEGLSLGALVDDFTGKILEKTLARCNGNKSQAAALLKVNRKIFYR